MNKINLTIGGKEYTAKLGLAFLERVTKEEGVTLNEMFEKFQNETLFFVPKLILHAIETAGGEITKEQVYDWIDEEGINNAGVTQFAEAFANSMQVHIPKEQSVGKQKPAKK